MRRRVFVLPYWVTSGVLHGALAAAIVYAVPERESLPEPVKIVLREVAAEPPPPAPSPPQPPPEPEAPPEPTPVEQPIAPPPTPTPTKSKPAPTKPPTPAPENPPPAAADVPDFGVALSNGNGPGLAVPVGDPGGVRSNGPTKSPPKSAATPKVLTAQKPTNDGCQAAEVKAQPVDVPQPAYSESARQAQVAGKVRVELSIDTTGQVTKVTIVESLHPDLDRATQETLRKARFNPATRCGKAVASTLKISIRFTL